MVSRYKGRQGQLSDHYDPRNKTLFLSEGVANSPSVASVAIAAHELGHAMQDAEDYFPMTIRSALVPAVNIGSNLGWILIMAGLLLRITNLAWLGVLVFSAGALFALATLPVELECLGTSKRVALFHWHHSDGRRTARRESSAERSRVDLCRWFGHCCHAVALFCLSCGRYGRKT